MPGTATAIATDSRGVQLLRLVLATAPPELALPCSGEADQDGLSVRLAWAKLKPKDATMRRLYANLILLRLLSTLLLAPLRTASGECLPTSGTFKDIYHENRAGVGQFDCFLVSPP